MEKGMEKGSQQLIPSIFPRKETVVPTLDVLRIGTLKIESPVVDRSQAYEWTSRIKREDKQSGSYERHTKKEKASTGELHVEKGTGQVGVKDEFMKSSTIRVGNKTGYTEYHIEQRVRDVNYDKSSISNESESDSDSDSDSYYGYDYDDDDDDDYY